VFQTRSRWIYSQPTYSIVLHGILCSTQREVVWDVAIEQFAAFTMSVCQLQHSIRLHFALWPGRMCSGSPFPQCRGSRCKVVAVAIVHIGATPKLFIMETIFFLFTSVTAHKVWIALAFVVENSVSYHRQCNQPWEREDSCNRLRFLIALCCYRQTCFWPVSRKVKIPAQYFL